MTQNDAVRNEDMTNSPLVKIFQENGTRVEAGGNKQLELWREDAVCLLISGHLDFFFTRLAKTGFPEGALYWCHSMETGGVFFCDTALQMEFSLLARGLQETVILKISRAEFESAARALEASSDWLLPAIQDWTEGVFGNLLAMPSQKIDYHLKDEEKTYEIPDAGAFSITMRNKQAAWLKVPEREATLKIGGMVDVKSADVDYVPLTMDLWYRLETDQPITLMLKSIDEVVDEDEKWRFLRHFHRLLLSTAGKRVDEIRNSTCEQHEAQKKVDLRVWKAAISHLAEVLEQGAHPADLMGTED